MHQASFETHVHHFTNAPLGPRLVESPDSRMAVACAPWAEWPTLADNVNGMRCGAYLLAGTAYPEGVVVRVYIGETIDWKRRLSEHAGDTNKKFATNVFVMGSFDPTFTKTDALLLQYYLNERAEQLDRASIIRGAKPPLPRADRLQTTTSQADFTDVQWLLPTAGCTILEPMSCSPNTSRKATDRAAAPFRLDMRSARASENASKTSSNHRSEQNFAPRSPVAAALPEGRPTDRERYQAPAIFVLEHAGLTAYGYQHGAEFVVLPGSHMRRDVQPSFAADEQNMQRRSDLIEARAVANVRGFQDRWRLRFERRLPSAPIAAKVLMGVNLTADAWRPVEADPSVA